MTEIEGSSRLIAMNSSCIEGPSGVENSSASLSVGPESSNRLKLPYLYPADLLEPSLPEQETALRPDDNRLDSEALGMNPCWWLLYTKSRQEKKVAEQLAAFQVPHFLPVVKRKSLSRGRTRTAQVPLFAGYLFLHGTDRDRLHALQTNRVTTMTLVADGDRLRCDLARIAQLIALDAPLTPESRLIEGQQVRVKAGLFAGYEGTVIKRSGKTRLFVAVQYMQMGASMEIQDYLLEPI